MRKTLTSRTTAIAILFGLVVAAAAILAIPSPAPSSQSTVSGLPESYQSAAAQVRLDTLPAGSTGPLFVVFHRTDGQPLSIADRGAVAGRLSPLHAVAHVSSLSSLLSKDSTAELLTLRIDGTAIEQAGAVPTIRTVATTSLPDGLVAQVTGESAFTADLTHVFKGADNRLLLATVLVVALLLVLTYRSPWLWLVPLTVVGASERVAAHLVGQIAPHFGVSIDGQAAGITSVLVFGAATDYALLLIARYRDELHTHADPGRAMLVAVRRSAEPICASAITVALALSTLLLAQQENLRAVGLSGAIGILVAMVTGLVATPAALVVFGRRLFWPRIPRLNEPITRGRWWTRVSDLIAARPRAVAASTLGLLVALILGAIGLHTGLAPNQQFSRATESALGSQTIERAFSAGQAFPVQIAASPTQAREVALTAARVNGVVQATVVATSATTSEIDAVLASPVNSKTSFKTIKDLRQRLAAIPGGSVSVGGSAATLLDTKTADSHDTRDTVPLILLIVTGALIVLLRALIAPLVLVGTVIMTFAAALGAGWLVSVHVLHDPAFNGNVVLLSFLFLVALGVDYNIFLVTRAKEATQHLATGPAMTYALVTTGTVITSAGVLLASVFAVLGVLPLVALAQIGLVVCIGVLLDTLLVRTMLVPSLAHLLGEAFWWPRRTQYSRGTSSSNYVDPVTVLDTEPQRVVPVPAEPSTPRGLAKSRR